MWRLKTRLGERGDLLVTAFLPKRIRPGRSKRLSLRAENYYSNTMSVTIRARTNGPTLTFPGQLQDWMSQFQLEPLMHGAVGKHPDVVEVRHLPPGCLRGKVHQMTLSGDCVRAWGGPPHALAAKTLSPRC